MVSPLGQVQISLPVTLPADKASARRDINWLALISRWVFFTSKFYSLSNFASLVGSGMTKLVIV